MGLGTFRAFVCNRCDYLGADLAPLGPTTSALDLDLDPLPTGIFDYVVMLGVLEYLHFPEQALKKAFAASRHAMISYCCVKPNMDAAQVIPTRRKRGWLNDFTRAELLAAAERGGGWLPREEPINEHADFAQAIFLFECAA